MMLTMPPVLGSAAVVVLITCPASRLSLVVVMGMAAPGPPPLPPATLRVSANMSSGVLNVIRFHWRRNTVASIRMVTMATQMVTRTVMVPNDQAASLPSLQPHSSLLVRKPQFWWPSQYIFCQMQWLRSPCAPPSEVGHIISASPQSPVSSSPCLQAVNTRVNPCLSSFLRPGN